MADPLSALLDDGDGDSLFATSKSTVMAKKKVGFLGMRREERFGMGGFVWVGLGWVVEHT